MKKVLLLAALLIASIGMNPPSVKAEQKPEMIAEKMMVKFTRGVANAVTSVIEFPKQTALTVNDMGAAGLLIGPLKGVGMTVYRCFIGAAEIAFFLVPQPGYYDPMIDPAYVWLGWEPKGDTSKAATEDK